MTILLLSDDLMLGSQVSAAAQQKGHTVRTSSNLEGLLGHCADTEVRQVILDMNVANVQPDTALAKLREACPSDTTFTAIAPHVHTAKLESAKQAGFDRVLTRGQFHGSMQEWLAE
jgi:DNA-binding response OmpR family regulator